MQALAEFENYAQEFAVTENDLITFGLGESSVFEAHVAECSVTQDLVGMAVSYTIPWTFDMLPTVVLKEMFVRPGSRGLGVGKALFSRVVQDANEVGASRVNWTVMEGNCSAEAFYADLGGRRDDKWQNWTLELPRC